MEGGDSFQILMIIAQHHQSQWICCDQSDVRKEFKHNLKVNRGTMPLMILVLDLYEVEKLHQLSKKD
jgi:hypothetical protein